MRVWSKVNIAVQGLILFGALVALITEPLFALAFTIPLGAWQVISGIVYAFKHEALSQIHKIFIPIYLSTSAMTLTLLYIAYRQEFAIYGSEELVIGIIASLSAILAISFFIFSIRVLKNVPSTISDPPSDILDQL